MDLRGRALRWVVALVALLAVTLFILRPRSRSTPHVPRPKSHIVENVEAVAKSVPALTVDQALALADDPETKGRVLRLLRSGTPEAIALLDALVDMIADDLQSLDAAELLDAVGPKAVPALMRGYRKGIGWAVPVLYGMVPDDEWYALVGEVMRGPSGTMKGHLTYFLEDLVPPEGELPLTEGLFRSLLAGMQAADPVPHSGYSTFPPTMIPLGVLDSEEYEVYRLVLRLKLPPEKFIALLDDPEVRVRQSVAQVLRGVEEPKARGLVLTALRRAIRDPSPLVRASAFDSDWPELQPEIVALLRNALEPARVRVRAIETLRYMRPTPVQPLLEALEDPDPYVRRAAARALAGRHAARLLPYLEDSDPYVRLEAAVALVDTEPALAKSTLAALLPAKDVQLVAQAALRLAAAGAKEHSGAIIVASFRLLETPWNQYAEEAIRHLGESGVPHLVAALRSEQSTARIRAARALGWLGKRATPAKTALAQAAESEDEDVSRAARLALASIQDDG